MKKIKWVFFDIDNTLFDSRRLAETARKNAVKAMIKAGLKANHNSAFKKLMQIVKKYGSNYPGHFDKLVETYKVPKEKRAQIIAAGIVEYHNTKFKLLKPFPKAKETLGKLKKKGCKLGVITNGRAVKQWDKLIRLGLADFFEVVVVSEEAKCKKPQPGIFKIALKRAMCRPQEALMIGDKKEDAAAKKAGMGIILLRGKKPYQENKLFPVFFCNKR